MKIMVLNGPNLNMVGIREKGIYGTMSYEDMLVEIQKYAKEKGVETDCRQSNHEGDLVDWIQEAYFQHYDGIVMNPGAYTHTSVAIADAVKAIAPIPVCLLPSSLCMPTAGTASTSRFGFIMP